MNRRSGARVWGVVAVLPGLAALSGAHADALSAVQVLRLGGCGGIVPAAQPLRHAARLDAAAAQWAAGKPLGQAAERSGFAADSTAGVHVSGPDAALLEILRRSRLPRRDRPVAARGRGFPQRSRQLGRAGRHLRAAGRRRSKATGAAAHGAARGANLSPAAAAATSAGAAFRSDAGGARARARQRRACARHPLRQPLVRARAAGVALGSAVGRGFRPCRRHGSA